jgi:ureidoacrylate peracid hydrolase
MHKVGLPADINERQWQDASRRAYFASFEAPRTALLVIDMQNHWVDERGLSYCPTAKGIVPNINTMAGALRDAGGHVIWITASLATQGRAGWQMLFEKLEDPASGNLVRSEIIPGHPMHELWPGLDVHEQDIRVAKDRFSAFIQGASGLEQILRDKGCDTIIVTGVATNICCESTARDGMMLDFRTVMVADANAARTDEDHIAGLRTIAQVFGGVMSTQDVIDRITA